MAIELRKLRTINTQVNDPTKQETSVKNNGEQVTINCGKWSSGKLQQNGWQLTNKRVTKETSGGHTEKSW